MHAKSETDRFRPPTKQAHLSGSGIEANVGNGDVGLEFSANSDQTNSAKPSGVERTFRSMRNKF